MHLAHVCNMEPVRLCILWSKLNSTSFLVSSIPSTVCVATLEVQSYTKPKLKVTLRRQNALGDAVILDHLAKESAYPISLSFTCYS